MPVSDENNIPAVERAIESAIDDALQTTGEQAVEHIKSGFDSSTDALGRPWVPNAPSTVAQKGFNRPLYRYGNLQESFKSKVDGDELTIFTDNPNAARNEFPRPGVPPRPIMQPAALWLERDVLDTAFNDRISDKLKGVEL